MQCLGEMATWLPLPGAIPQYCARFVDDALGFAVGWNVSSYAYVPLEVLGTNSPFPRIGISMRSSFASTSAGHQLSSTTGRERDTYR